MLISSLPGGNAAPRIRLWRALKAAGAASVRDGVYALPDRPGLREPFAALRRETAAAGGTAYLFTAATASEAETEALRRLFDRREQYAALVAAAGELAGGLAARTEADARRALRQLTREYEAITAVDFFGSGERERAQRALAAANDALVAAFSPGEPTSGVAAIERRERARYTGRVWATRRNLWVDRVASAWLIRRFIDPDARFCWLDDPRKAPHDAVGFDFDGAPFSHAGELTTFEVLVASFDLGGDAALAKIGTLVRALDVGGARPPESAGFEALLEGARRRSDDDDGFLERISEALDSLYAAFGA